MRVEAREAAGLNLVRLHILVEARGGMRLLQRPAEAQMVEVEDSARSLAAVAVAVAPTNLPRALVSSRFLSRRPVVYSVDTFCLPPAIVCPLIIHGVHLHQHFLQPGPHLQR